MNELEAHAQIELARQRTRQIVVSIGLACMAAVGIALGVSPMSPRVAATKVDTTFAVRHNTVWTVTVTDSLAGIPQGAVVCVSPLGQRVFPNSYVSPRGNVIPNGVPAALENLVFGDFGNRVYCEQR